MTRQQYEAEVISLFAQFGRQPSISDNDRDCEHKAMSILIKAYPLFVSAMQDAAALSDIRKDQINEALSILSDAMPDCLSWEEQISAEKMGY